MPNKNLKTSEQSKETKTDNSADIKKNKNIAALSYIWILCLVPLLIKPHSKFAQFHAKQGLILFIAEIIGGILVWIPFFGQLFMLTLLIVSIICVIKTLNGEWWKIPYIYDLSKKINL